MGHKFVFYGIVYYCDDANADFKRVAAFETEWTDDLVLGGSCCLRGVLCELFRKSHTDVWCDPRFVRYGPFALRGRAFALDVEKEYEWF